MKSTQETEKKISDKKMRKKMMREGLPVKVSECIMVQLNEEHLEVEVFAKAGNGKWNGVSLWKHPSQDQKENHWIHKNSVLPVRPMFGVNKYSTHR